MAAQHGQQQPAKKGLLKQRGQHHRGEGKGQQVPIVRTAQHHFQQRIPAAVSAPHLLQQPAHPGHD
ncbi:MAG: hypothetical protein ACK55I_06240, partial [bacterium]